MRTLELIEKYWDGRAETYSTAIREELNSDISKQWESVISRQVDLNSETPLRVLDIGTGPGFFARLFANHGHRVDAIDCSLGMIERAKRNTHGFADRVTFQLMDATELSFADDTFDVIVTRNLTWNLIDPEKAYAEWHRVLKSDGVLLNFDANWYRYLVDEEINARRIKDQENLEIDPETNASDDQCIACEQIALSLPLTTEVRPKWDMKVLEDVGFSKTRHDTTVWQNVWSSFERRMYANSSPLFLVSATK